MSNSSGPHGLWPSRLLQPWNIPGKSTAVGCHLLLQGIFPTQGSNPGLPLCRQTVCHLSHQWFGQKSHFLTRGSLCLQVLSPPLGHITSYLEISTSACLPRTLSLRQLLGCSQRCLIQLCVSRRRWSVSFVGWTRAALTVTARAPSRRFSHRGVRRRCERPLLQRTLHDGDSRGPCSGLQDFGPYELVPDAVGF